MEKNEFIGRLVEIFGQENVIIDEKITAEYAKDFCPRNFVLENINRPCLAVVSIDDTFVENLKDIISLAKIYGKKIVVRGGGSGVCGAVVPREPENTVIIDMTRLDSVYEVNTDEGFISAGAGIKGDVLEAAAQGCGYTIGHSPASLAISTLGGWLATRSSGQFSARYGTIEDLVLEIEVVVANGETRIWTGQEMNSFLRMEGTTGIITRAKLKIFPISRQREYLAVSFKDLRKALGFVDAAIRLRNKMEQNRVWLSALRLYDFVDYYLIAKPHKEDRGNPPESVSRIKKLILIWPWLINFIFAVFRGLGLLKNTVLIVLESDSEQEIIRARKNVLNMAKNFNGHSENPEITKIWLKNRFKLNCEKLTRILEDGFTIDTLDCRPSHPNLVLAHKLYRAIKKMSGRLVLTGAHFGIDREGIYIYFTFIGYGADQSIREKISAELWSGLLRTCSIHKAFSTHHHGIGILKGGPSNIFSPHAYGRYWFEQIAKPAKQKLDPDNIFNPGNII